MWNLTICTWLCIYVVYKQIASYVAVATSLAKDYGFTGMQYAIVSKMDNQIYSVLWIIIYQCTVNTISHKCTGDTNFGICLL